MKTRITIADDHPLIINGLVQIVKCCDDIEIISTYTSGNDLLQGLKLVQPDILLLDIHMPNGSGDEVASVISAEYKEIKIIALTNQDSTYYVKTMMGFGAAGYVLKTSGADSIIEAIRSVTRDEVYIDPVLKDKLVQDTIRSKSEPEMPELTRREKEVLDLIADNLSSQEMAERLFVSKRTIDNHRLNLLLKLGVKNSATLVKRAMQLGLIKP